MGVIVDIKGQTFGRLTVISFSHRVKKNEDKPGTFWNCKCECGKLVKIRSCALRSGNTKSCGCLHDEGNNKIHGRKHTKEYNSWIAMRQRCNNPNIAKYENYGGRNIKVCDRWMESFENFLEDMGLKPTPKHSLDRIDNDGNYEPGNCRWATNTEQQLNTRKNVYFTFKEETKTQSEWSKELGIPVPTLCRRIKDGWTVEEALSTPVKKFKVNKKKQHNG